MDCAVYAQSQRSHQLLAISYQLSAISRQEPLLPADR